MKKLLSNFKTKKLIFSFLMIMCLSLTLFSTTALASGSVTKSQGDIKVTIREDYHPIPSVNNYLNGKYGTRHRNVSFSHANVEIYYQGEEVRNYHIVTYKCNDCGHLGVLIYDYDDGIEDLHNCDDDDGKSRAQLAHDGLKKVKSLGSDALDNLGASLLQLAYYALIFAAILTLAVAIIVALPILVL